MTLPKKKRLHLTLTDFKTNKTCMCTHIPEKPQPKAQSVTASHGDALSSSALRAAPFPISSSTASAA